MERAGVFYIATGDQFVAEAEVSAQSVRDAMPNIPIAIATDINPDFEFDYVINITDPDYTFTDQISHLHRSPFQRTLHLDTDTYVYTDSGELFDLLDQFDVAAAHNHNRSAFNVPGIPKSFPEYNTGVVVYENTDQFQNFTQSWMKNYEMLYKKDNPQNQPSFRKTLYESDLELMTLPPEYNLMLRYPGHAIGTVKIFHGRLLDIETPGSNTYVDVDKAVQKINSTTGHRVFTQVGGLSTYSNRSNSIDEIRTGIWRYGFIGSFRKGLSKIHEKCKKLY